MAFDLAYYQRFYFNRRTAVTSRAEMRARARLIAGLRRLHRPAGRARSWMPAAASACCGHRCCVALKRASYTGLEFSDYLCQRYGWPQGSIESFRTRERFDLVICYDVLQYLSAAAARARDRESGPAVPRARCTSAR